MTEFSDRCRELVGFHFRRRLQFALQRNIEDELILHELPCFFRTEGVNEARLFIRLCRVEEERTEKRRRIFLRDRPYWSYYPWY
jgi:hypothetical protein